MSPFKSTSQLSGNFGLAGSTHGLTVGPIWNSFEDFRTAGNGGLEKIPLHGVAVLNCKAGSFRIIRDADFQDLVGVASEVVRLQGGLKVIFHAARIAVKHPDEEHIRMLMESARLVAECPELPQREGHVPLRLTPQELTEEAADDFDAKTDEIPRPSW
jgi:hypothetical protein